MDLNSPVLASPTRIAISDVGSNMWTCFYRRYGDLEGDLDLDACLGAMERYKHVRFIQPDFARVRSEFLQVIGRMPHCSPSLDGLGGLEALRFYGAVLPFEELRRRGSEARRARRAARSESVPEYRFVDEGDG